MNYWKDGSVPHQFYPSPLLLKDNKYTKYCNLKGEHDWNEFNQKGDEGFYEFVKSKEYQTALGEWVKKRIEIEKEQEPSIFFNKSKCHREEFSIDDKREILKSQKYKCEICDKILPLEPNGLVEFHHKIPCKDGGDNDISNGVALCPDCHKGIHRMEFEHKFEHKFEKLSYIDLKKYWKNSEYYRNIHKSENSLFAKLKRGI